MALVVRRVFPSRFVSWEMTALAAERMCPVPARIDALVIVTDHKNFAVIGSE
jgi:hypothetical protein